MLALVLVVLLGVARVLRVTRIVRPLRIGFARIERRRVILLRRMLLRHLRLRRTIGSTARGRRLPDQARQLGKRIFKLLTTGCTGITAGRTIGVVGHGRRPASGAHAIQVAPRPQRYFENGVGNLSHLVGRCDPKQPKPRGENGRHALYKHKPGLSYLSIILDNEA